MYNDEIKSFNVDYTVSHSISKSEVYSRINEKLLAQLSTSIVGECVIETKGDYSKNYSLRVLVMSPEEFYKHVQLAVTKELTGRGTII